MKAENSETTETEEEDANQSQATICNSDNEFDLDSLLSGDEAAPPDSDRPVKTPEKTEEEKKREKQEKNDRIVEEMLKKNMTYKLGDSKDKAWLLHSTLSPR